MSDEEFLALKKQIKEVGGIYYKINCTFRELKNEISKLNKSISDFQLDISKLKSEVNSLEEI